MTYGDVRHSAMSANIVSDGFHHTLPSGSFFHEKPLMSPVETEDLSRTWDYLVGHVGIKVGMSVNNVGLLGWTRRN